MKVVVTERDVPAAGELRVPPRSIVTDSAREAAALRGVRIVEVSEDDYSRLAPPEKTIALGSDHGGFAMKEYLRAVLDELGWAVRDVGVHEEKAVDYPDIAEAVANLVASGKALAGVIVDGAGIGSAMAANKVPGIRAALCYDRASARNSREHNAANVLTLGGRLLTETQAEDVLRTWLATPFGGGRHQGRIDKLTAIERRYSTWKPSNSNS
jgi:ribose 5-phosphate isomerase B